LKAASIILLVIICTTAYAQDDPDTLNLPKSKLDSLKGVGQHKLDTIFRTADNITNKADSLINSPLQFGNSLRTKIKGRADSLGLNERKQKVSSLPASLQNRIRDGKDSLAGKRPGLPDHTGINDSLGLDKLKMDQPQIGQGKINEVQDKVNSKIADVNPNVGDKINKPVGKVNDAMGNLSKEADGQGNLPQNLKINTGNINQPAVDVKSKLPDVKTPDMGGMTGEVNKVKDDLKKPVNTITKGIGEKKNDLTGDLKEKVSDLKESGLEKVGSVNPKDKLNKVRTSSEMEKLNEGRQDLSDGVSKAKGYTEDAKNVSKGNIEKVSTAKSDLVKKVSERDELKSAGKDLKMVEEQQKQLLALKNKEEFKKQTLARARTVLTEQFATQQQQIVSTVNKVSEYQKKMGTIHAKVKDLPKRPRREKRPPLIERFVPGVTVQVQKSANWMVDLNPGLRFRVRSIFSIGAGWNERSVFSNSFKFFSGERIFGPRAIMELSIKRGLWLKADVERMNAFVPLAYNQPDNGNRKWVWSCFGGLRKDFSIVPGLTGNVQFMYNLYDPKRQSPYTSKFNVRFGFELPVKKQGK
jgi:hypothetical protein